MGGISSWEALVLGLLVLVLVGPDRLPTVMEHAARWLAKLRSFIRGARAQVSQELGEELDLGSLRQYDPRAVLRDSLFSDEREERPAKPDKAPFDSEAT